MKATRFFLFFICFFPTPSLYCCQSYETLKKIKETIAQQPLLPKEAKISIITSFLQDKTYPDMQDCVKKAVIEHLASKKLTTVKIKGVSCENLYKVECYDGRIRIATMIDPIYLWHEFWEKICLEESPWLNLSFEDVLSRYLTIKETLHNKQAELLRSASDCKIPLQFITATPEAMLYYCAIKKIRQNLSDLIKAEATKPLYKTNILIGVSRGNELPDPSSYHRTQQGILFETSNNIPEYLYSPWGMIKLVDIVVSRGKNADIFWKSITTGLLNSMKTKIHDVNNIWITYQLLGVDGKNLPDAIEAKSIKADFMDSWEEKKYRYLINKVWGDMAAEYLRTAH